jgi:hypothetical protein
VACIGEGSCVYRGLVGKCEEKRLPPGRDRGQWEDNTKMGNQEMKLGAHSLD